MKKQMRTFSSGATRDTDAGKLDFDCLSPLVLERYADYCLQHSGTLQGIRPVDNWQKGMPRSAYAKSLTRHFMQFWKLHRGFKTKDEKGRPVTIEDALCAVIFNAQGYLFEKLLKRP
jgi:hypothetical protein